MIISESGTCLAIVAGNSQMYCNIENQKYKIPLKQVALS